MHIVWTLISDCMSVCVLAYQSVNLALLCARLSVSRSLFFCGGSPPRPVWHLAARNQLKARLRWICGCQAVGIRSPRPPVSHAMVAFRLPALAPLPMCCSACSVQVLRVSRHCLGWLFSCNSSLHWPRHSFPKWLRLTVWVMNQFSNKTENASSREELLFVPTHTPSSYDYTLWCDMAWFTVCCTKRKYLQWMVEKVQHFCGGSRRRSLLCNVSEQRVLAAVTVSSKRLLHFYYTTFVFSVSSSSCPAVCI